MTLREAPLVAYQKFLPTLRSDAPWKARALFRRHAELASRRDAERSKVAIAPILPTSESGAGLSLSVRF